MKNLLSVVFILLLSISVAMAQSDQGSEETTEKRIEQTENSATSQKAAKSQSGKLTKRAGCCKKKGSSNAKMGCHGNAHDGEACCDKHASAGTKKKEQ